MKIVTKQVLGYFLVTALVGSLAILGVYLVNSNITEIVNIENPKVVASLEMEINIKELFDATRDYNVSTSRRALVRFDESIRRYKKFRERYKERIVTAEEGLRLKEFDEMVQQLINIGRNIIRLQSEIDAIYNSEIKEARLLIKLRDTQTEAMAKSQSLYREINDLLDYKIQALAQDRIKAAEQRALDNIAILIISILGVVIIGILFGYIASIKMSRPLIRLRDASRQIGLGNMDTEVAITSEDEIGELGNAFNKMVANIKETTVSRDHLNKIIQNIGDIVLVADSSGAIRISNPIASDILEYSHESLDAKNIGELMAMEGELIDVDRLESLIIGRSIAYHDITFRTASGVDMPVNCSASIIRNNSDERELLVIVARDMRAIKHLMEDKARLESEKMRGKELEKINTLLLENEKILREEKKKAEAASRAKTAFLATMSHELRTPMNSIIGYTRLVLQNAKEELSEDMYRNLERVDISSAHLLKVINDILDLSKIEAGELVLEDAPFSLSETLKNAIRTIKGALKNKPLQITYNLEENVPDHLMGDPGRLMQVMLNLLDNAVKFTAEGSVTLNISLENRKKDLANIRFEVKDTGIGIPQDKAKAIFDPFTQADMSTTRRYGGTGLGLSISKSIVEGMKGRIWVESTEGVGSNFIFVIPIRIMETPVQ
ncbi:MAG: HAMP domain-containing protein [Nitrospinae bacterium]|nr:HAMP domain-containing protein [Nitrospinota bacterium]